MNTREIFETNGRKIGLEEAKCSLIIQLYTVPADQDYLAARQSYLSGLHYPFYWLSAQALEKYLKALLLLHGHNAKKSSHNLIDLWKRVKNEIDAKFGSFKLDMASSSGVFAGSFHGRDPDFYLSEISRLGDPDNRYGIYGQETHVSLLYALDQLVCVVRTAIASVNFPAGGLRKYLLDIDRNNSKMLLNFDWMIGPMLLERVYYNKLDTSEQAQLRKVFVVNNFSFGLLDHGAETDVEVFGGLYFHGPILSNYFRRLPEAGISKKNAHELRALRKWVLENIKIPSSLKESLFDERKWNEI